MGFVISTKLAQATHAKKGGQVPFSSCLFSLCDEAAWSAPQSSTKQQGKNVPAEVMNNIMTISHFFIAAKIHYHLKNKWKIRTEAPPVLQEDFPADRFANYSGSSI